MKIAVLSPVGKVGKSTICAHLLSPRMDDAPIFAVETQNETVSSLGLEVENKFKGDEFRKLFMELAIIDDAIIDIGASNIEGMLKKMLSMGEESHEEIDCFIIPVVPGSVEQRETIRFVKMLSDMGIPKNKIRIIFNKVDSDVEDEFPAIIGFAEMEKKCIVNTKAAIYSAETYDLLSNKKINIAKILNDETDFKALARNEELPESERDHYRQLYAVRSFAKGAKRNLDAAFKALFD